MTEDNIHFVNTVVDLVRCYAANNDGANAEQLMDAISISFKKGRQDVDDDKT